MNHLMKKYNLMGFLKLYGGMLSLYFISFITLSHSTFMIHATRFLPSFQLGLVGLTFITIYALSIWAVKILTNARWEQYFFYGVMISAIAVVIVIGYITRGQSIQTILLPDKHDAFMDFFNSVQYGFKPYEAKVIYPPLINVIYGFLGRFMIIGNGGTYALRENQMAVLVFATYTIFLYVLLCYTIYKIKAGSTQEKALFMIILFFSLPFIFALERGNSVLIALLFLFIFVQMYERHNCKYSLMAYISLAIATGIKISPAVYGLLYIRNREFKKAVKAAIVVILLFFLPFGLTDGNIFVLIHNIMNTDNIREMVVQGYELKMVGSGIFVNLSSTLEFVGRFLNINLYNFTKILSIIIFFFSVTAIVFDKILEKWKVYALLSGIIVLIPGFSAIYNLVYFTIPLVYFIDSRPRKNRLNLSYALLFIGIFALGINVKLNIFNFTLSDWYPMKITTLISGWGVLLIVVVILFESGVHLYSTYLKNIISVHPRYMSVFGLTIISFGIILFLVLGNHFQSIKSFTPGNFKVINAGKGFNMKHGVYTSINPNGAFLRLDAESILKNGLVFVINPSKLSHNYNECLSFTINNQNVGTYTIDTSENTMVYIPADKLIQFSDSKELVLKIKAEDPTCKNIPVLFIGPALGIHDLNSDKFLLRSTSGLINSNGTIVVKNDVIRVLVSKNDLFDGLDMDLYISPDLLQLYDGTVPINIKINDKRMYTERISKAGIHSLTFCQRYDGNSEYNEILGSINEIKVFLPEYTELINNLNIQERNKTEIAVKRIHVKTHVD